jgi:hypothetical protein
MAPLGPFQAGIAESHAGNYGYILSWTIAVVAVALMVVTAFGPEAHATELRVSS